MMIQLDRKQKITAISALVVVLLMALVYFVVAPQVKAYQQSCAQLRDLQGKVGSTRITANSLRASMAAFNQAKDDLDSVTKLFDTEMRDGSDVVLLGLKSAATEVTITSITPGDIVEKPNYLELPLNITASGNYLNVVAFYTDIERLPNLTDIRMFKILAAPTTDDDSNVTITMSVIVFSGKNPQEQLGLEEIRNWAIGRSNIFEPVGGGLTIPAPSPSPSTLPQPLNAASLIQQ
jgi:Tfp pilus assembly protein PilO